jgi:hypothetical protein
MDEPHKENIQRAECPLDYCKIHSPETELFNIEGKIQTLEDYLSTRLKITKESKQEDIDLSLILNKPSNIYLKSVEGNVYFDTDKLNDNIIGKFNGLFIRSSCPKLLLPKKIAETFVISSAYTIDEMIEYKEEHIKGIKSSRYTAQNNPLAFINYVENAQNRKEVKEQVDNTYLYYNSLELKKSFYNYLETFRI